MKFYKIRHKKSGFFWQPDKVSGNVSKKGKVYQKKPNLDYVTGTVLKLNKSGNPYDFTSKSKKLIEIFNVDINQKCYSWQKYRIDTIIDDWEIIEFNVNIDE